jgi:PTH1 family peptidyl-tRNA hydrolase
MMLLLVGLGNPGAQYARHRHNVGFMAVDKIADAAGFGPSRRKFRSELREGEIAGQKALALKPQTYMNDSGEAVGEAMRFYKLAPADVVVFHDELDLAPGKIKVKTGGGVAGHNGLKSIGQHIGAEFRRVRIGIGHPGSKERVTGHVLGDFSKDDQSWLSPLLDALAARASFIADGDARYATAIAEALAPPRPQREKPPTPRAPSPQDAPKADNPFAAALKPLAENKDKD